VTVDPTVPLLVVLAMANAVFARWRPRQRTLVVVDLALVLLSALLLKDWVEGLLFLVWMP
jgi:hypothetical protein